MFKRLLKALGVIKETAVEEIQEIVEEVKEEVQEVIDDVKEEIQETVDEIIVTDREKFEAMTKNELKAYARELGLKIDGRSSKKTIIEKLLK